MESLIPIKPRKGYLSLLTDLSKKIIGTFKEGFDLYQDNIALYAEEKLYRFLLLKKIKNIVPIVEEPKMTLKEAFDFGLKLKEKLINPTTK